MMCFIYVCSRAKNVTEKHAGNIERRPRVNNEAKERLRTIARKLVDVSFVEACDDASTEEEFQKAVDALVNHLMKVRKRSQTLHREKEMA
jgi:hypothetical protein